MSLILSPGTRLVAATHNPGKAKELAELLDGRFELIAAGALGLPEPEETEASFVGNALLKARRAADASGLIALADDSGLSVAALDGAPGIYSARWAGPNKDFRAAMERVHAEMGEAEDPGAWFISVLCLAWPDGHFESFEGRVDGTTVWPPRGTGGFGYDPMFKPQGEEETYGEMDQARKTATSHRARAFAALVRGCLGAPPRPQATSETTSAP